MSFDWKLCWNHRIANALANAVAKDSLLKNLELSFDVVNLSALPSLLSEIDCQDMLGRAL